ncbi:MAG TPA: hypothetical protein VF661_14700, partial [Actinomycetales bacterium]|jgi:hypothetical protein
VLAVALVAGGVAMSVLPDPWVWGAAAAVRNAAGFCGLVLLASVLLPARAAWAPAFGYGVVVYLAAPRGPIGAQQWWAWPMVPGQLASSGTSYAAAALLLATGVVAYAASGPRSVAPDMV